MSLRFASWDEVVAFALALPGTTAERYYNDVAVKVNGKAFVSPGGVPGSFHVASPHGEKAVLLETDPDTFWQTPHYANWPGLLVRFAPPDPERVATVVRRAWWDKASRAQRQAHGERP